MKNESILQDLKNVFIELNILYFSSSLIVPPTMINLILIIDYILIFQKENQARISIRLGSIIPLYPCQFLYILIYMFHLKFDALVSNFDKAFLVLLRIPLLR